MDGRTRDSGVGRGPWRRSFGSKYTTRLIGVGTRARPVPGHDTGLPPVVRPFLDRRRGSVPHDHLLPTHHPVPSFLFVFRRKQSILVGSTVDPSLFSYTGDLRPSGPFRLVRPGLLVRLPPKVLTHLHAPPLTLYLTTLVPVGPGTSTSDVFSSMPAPPPLDPTCPRPHLPSIAPLRPYVYRATLHCNRYGESHRHVNLLRPLSHPVSHTGDSQSVVKVSPEVRGARRDRRVKRSEGRTKRVLLVGEWFETGHTTREGRKEREGRGNSDRPTSSSTGKPPALWAPSLPTPTSGHSTSPFRGEKRGTVVLSPGTHVGAPGLPNRPPPVLYLPPYRPLCPDPRLPAPFRSPSDPEVDRDGRVDV